MTLRTTLAVAACASVLAAAASAQPGAGQAPRFQNPPPEKSVTVTAIPGVIAEGAKWRQVLTGTNNIDGLMATPDGGVIFAQEQNSTLRKVDAAGRESVYLSETHGAGSVSQDASGRLFVAQRTCTDPGLKLGANCKEPTAIAELQPQRKTLVSGFPDGKGLGRVNDLIADGKGGAFFTSGGVFHAGADGVLTVVEDKDIRTNGIQLSRDGRTLYVTNNTEVVAFDVGPDGKTSNRHVFASLDGDTGGDGSAIDGEGRLYVTASQGVHVISPAGQHLGVIPTPRRPITVTFSGPGNGGLGPDGKEWATPPDTRNTAMTLYAIPVLTEGFKGRLK